MGQPVVHVEIIGREPAALRRFYRELFGWENRPRDAVTEPVSRPGEYGFVDGIGAGVDGGVGGGEGHSPGLLVHVGVPDVDVALERPSASAGPACSARRAPRGRSSSGGSPTPKAP